MQLWQVFSLLVAFQIKHFFADYPWQTPYMLQKFKAEGWVKPLAAHAAVHALLTYVICSVFLLHGRYFLLAVGLSLFDFVMHFGMDRVKASPKMLGRYKALSAGEFPTATPEQKQANVYFWWALGLDQAWHHLTHYAIIFVLCYTTL